MSKQAGSNQTQSNQAQTDPRVFFAAERTLLAWLRTGLTIIALGFIVSRFGLFMALFASQTGVSIATNSTDISAALGVAFVLIGSLAIATSALQFKRFVETLGEHHLPPAYSSKLAMILAMVIAMFGIVLALYLWHA